MIKKQTRNSNSKELKKTGYIVIACVTLIILVLVSGFYIFRYVKNQHDMANIEKRIMSIQAFMTKENDNMKWYLKKECNQPYAGLLKKLQLTCEVSTSSIIPVEDTRATNILINNFHSQLFSQSVGGGSREIGGDDIHVNMTSKDVSMDDRSGGESIKFANIEFARCFISYTIMNTRD